MMAEYIGVQQPPIKKFRSSTNSNESGKRNKKIDFYMIFLDFCTFEDFDFKMMTSYDTSDTNNTQDPFDIGNDFTDTLNNTQQQSSTSSASTQSSVTISSGSVLNQQSSNLHQQAQSRLTYISQTRAQLPSYQTPNLQRIQTMPTTSTITRLTNVLSNGVQQQPAIYTQQQQQMINSSGGLNRSSYQRMPTIATTQQPNMSSTLARQQYNSTNMINLNQNVPQMNIVKVRRKTKENSY